MHVVNTCALTRGGRAQEPPRGQPGRPRRPHVRHRLRRQPERRPVRRDGVDRGGPLGRPRRGRDRRAPGRRPPARLRRRRPARPGAHARLPQGAERLRLALRVLHHPHHPGRGREPRRWTRILRDARRRLEEGHPELVLTGINIGTWRDAGRRRPGRPGARRRRAPGPGPPAHLLDRARRRHGPAAAGDGRDAGRGAAPARAAPVRRPGRPGRDGPLLHRRALPRRLRPGAGGDAGRQPHHRRDRGLPGRGRGRRSRATDRGGGGGRRSPRCTCSRTRRGPGPGGAAWPGACRPRRPASGARGCATSRTGPASAHRAARVGDRDVVLVEKAPPDGALPASARTTRGSCSRPAPARPAGWSRWSPRASPASTCGRDAAA